MRIGIDMLAVQAPGARAGAVGRYAAELVAALLTHCAEIHFVLYAHDGLPTEAFPYAHETNSETQVLTRSPGAARWDAIERLSQSNPDGLDVLLILSPFEDLGGYFLPAPPRHGVKLAALVHDLGPLCFPSEHLADADRLVGYQQRLETLRAYDTWLVPSEAARFDVLRRLGFPAERVVAIGGVDPSYGPPAQAAPMEIAERAALTGLGIKGPFLLTAATGDDLPGLVEAFAQLPARWRVGYQLVIESELSEADRATLHALWAEHGLGDTLLFASAIGADLQRSLYQRCTLFVDPSPRARSATPLLQAMQCGASVVASNGDVGAEIVADAGLLARPGDPADLACKITQVLTDPNLAGKLSQRARTRARPFGWGQAARRARAALARPAAPFVHPRAPLPRLAIFSPLPPVKSGISDYLARLVAELRSDYTIDLYHDSDYVPEESFGAIGLSCYDYRLYSSRAAAVEYHALVYQMGNSLYHKFLYPTMLRHRGIVTLHDFCLSGFHHWYALNVETFPAYIEAEVRHCCPERADELLPALNDLCGEPGNLQEAFARRGVYLNRRIFDCAHRVVLHSTWALKQVQALFPEHLARTALIPMGATPRHITEGEKAAIRARFKVPPEALVFASFGNLHPTKMNVEAIDAFAPLAKANPHALYLFVGHDWGVGEARRRAQELGIDRQVRLLGHQPASAFADLIAIADIGISLRLPPTNGETSASLLDLLGAGVATVITDVGTFSEYPERIVRKVKWEQEGIAGLRKVFHELATDAPARLALGQAAQRYVAERHTWPRAAALYRDVIEQCHAEQQPRPAVPQGVFRGPHRNTISRPVQSPIKEG